MSKPNSDLHIGAHQIILQDRNFLDLSGVADVDSFDDIMITAYTSMGALKVRGRELHIQKLNLDDGVLSVAGKIDELIYDDTPKGGFFSRLFR